MWFAHSLTMTPLEILWYSRSPHPCPLGLAAQLGWFIDEFRDDGIRVFTVQDSADPTLRDSHLDHHLPNSIRQGGNVPAIWARSRGARTRVVGLSWMNEFQGIVSLPGSGIEVPADLAGRRVALPVYDSSVDGRRSEALHGFLIALGGAGLQPKDVRFVDVAADRHWHPEPVAKALGTGSDSMVPAVPPGVFGEYARQIGALLRHEVDAVYVKGARGLRAAHIVRGHIVQDLRVHPDPMAQVHTGTPRPITVDEELLRTHPEVVERFLARILAAGEWAATHPRETAAYISRETQTTEEFVREAYGIDVHRHLVTDLAPRSVQALESQQHFLHEWGFINKGFDVRAWIEPGPLAAARERVSDHALQVL